MNARVLALIGLILVYGFILLCFYGLIQEAYEDLLDAWWSRWKEPPGGAITWAVVRIAFALVMAYATVMVDLVPGIQQAPPL
jgi:hypothetical protein